MVVKTINDIFDKLNPNMSLNELVRVCYDMRDLKLRQNPNIKIDRDNYVRQISIDKMKRDTSAAEYDSDNNDHITINESYVQHLLNKDESIIVLSLLAHELQHFNQKYETDPKKLALYDSTKFSDEAYCTNDYNMVDIIYKPYILNFGLLEILNSVFNKEYSNSFSSDIDDLLEFLHGKLHVNNETEKDADLYAFDYLLKDLENYMKSIDNADRKKWFEKQFERLSVEKFYASQEVKYYNESASFEKKQKYVNHLLNTLVAYSKNNDYIVRTPINLLLDVYEKTGLIDNEFRMEFMSIANHISNSKAVNEFIDKKREEYKIAKQEFKKEQNF